LDEVFASARRGALLREGFSVVLVGEPNVGKSSLLNALAGAELAIVTPVAGTTRDRISQTIQIEGVPVRVVDTAGLRETHDEVERIGIARAWEAVGEADCVLHLVDAREVMAGGDATGARGDQQAQHPRLSPAAHEIASAMASRLDPATPRLFVCNKVDLLTEPRPPDGATQVWLSAQRGDGIDRLRAKLLALAGGEPGAETTFIARERHLQALAGAREHVALALVCLEAGSARLELAAEELRLAQTRLGSITGWVSADALLGEIFSRFCIGK
jgi:tRNA modification GTPase